MRDAARFLRESEALAHEIVAMGARIGLPFVAAAADISSAHPPLGVDGRPLAETVFQWIDPALRYWEDHSFALKAAFIHAARA